MYWDTTPELFAVSALQRSGISDQTQMLKLVPFVTAAIRTAVDQERQRLQDIAGRKIHEVFKKEEEKP